MDKLERYQTLIKQFMSDYANLINSFPKIGLETLLIFDDERAEYLLIETGWQNKRHIRYIRLHVRLSNHKIWIEEDMTEEGIATYFLEQGVPREDIVLGFQPPEMRQYTEFGVA